MNFIRFYENLRVQDPETKNNQSTTNFGVYKSERFAREWCTFYKKFKN